MARASIRGWTGGSSSAACAGPGRFARAARSREEESRLALAAVVRRLRRTAFLAGWACVARRPRRRPGGRGAQPAGPVHAQRAARLDGLHAAADRLRLEVAAARA